MGQAVTITRGRKPPCSVIERLQQRLDGRRFRHISRPVRRAHGVRFDAQLGRCYVVSFSTHNMGDAPRYRRLIRIKRWVANHR